MKLTKIARFAMALTVVVAAPVLAQQAGRGRGNGPGQGTGPVVDPQPATAEEIQVLTFMREEEKLARDVYRFLFEKWGATVFDRIAASEQQHFEQVGTLMARYGIADPAVNDLPGVFANEALAKMYAELTAKGAASLKDALEVGVLIEKTDIADLEAALPETAKLDVKRVFTNLMLASYNHLEAFEFYLATI